MRSITLEKWSDMKTPKAVAYPIAVTRDQRVLMIEEDLHQFNGVDSSTHRGGYVVKIIDGNEGTHFTAADFPFVPDRLDMFTDGTVLLASSFCWRKNDWVQKNARRYSADGECLDEFVLGTGLSGVAIDDEDTIWVAYHEEGVYGNHGWHYNPIGSAGLVAFSQTGQIRWEARKYNIHEMGSMNIQAAEHIYINYSLFSNLVHLNHFDEVRKVKLPDHMLLGPFTMLSPDVIFEAGCHPGQARLLLNGRWGFETKERFQMIDAAGNKLDGRNIMRGNALFVFTDTGIYKKDITLDLLKKT